HMRLPIPIDREEDVTVVVNHDHEHMHGADSDYSGMGGMIMGITVTGASAATTSSTARTPPPDGNPGASLDSPLGPRGGIPAFTSCRCVTWLRALQQANHRWARRSPARSSCSISISPRKSRL